MRHLFSLLLVTGALFQVSQAQTTFFIEDFEDATLEYTATPADNLANITDRQYHGRITPSSGLPTAVMFTNGQGDAFFSAEDTDDFPNNGNDLITLDFDDINISGKTMIEFCVYLAEDPTGASEHWDTNSSVKFGYDIDNSGSFSRLFAIESSGVNNTAPAIDVDGDGTGEGTEITGAFTQHCFNISGTGSLIDLKIEIDKLNNAEEDIAIDNVELKGVDNTPPPVDPNIPTMGQWALLILALLMTSLGLVALYNEKRYIA